jgi:hypothetical protein
MPNGLPSFDGYEGATVLQEVAGERTAANFNLFPKSGQSGLSNEVVIHCCPLATIDEWPLFESEAKQPDSGAECPSATGFA